MTEAVITESSVGNTQAERTALSDQRMFEVAIELVNERGTAKTTLKDIGEGAGYSRGLASYRFGSKDGLWMELFARFDDIWKAHLSQYLKASRGWRRSRLRFRRSGIFLLGSQATSALCIFSGTNHWVENRIFGPLWPAIM